VRRSWSVAGATLGALLCASLAGAESVTTKERARLREGPSATTNLVGEVPGGIMLQMLGESGGWKQVRTPEGRTGYVWAEHLNDADGTHHADTPSGPPRGLADEVHDLRDEVGVLRERAEPATSADLEKVKQELERLAAAERDLARRLDERFVAGPAVDPLPESTSGPTVTLLFVGGAIGYVASRFAQRRRDSRQRNRLRL